MPAYKNDLNPAQYEAATTLEGPVLVIAGAGSGKTRTIVYRLAQLIRSGAPASSILLLTFTRKAAQEMLDRARHLLSESSDTTDNSFSAEAFDILSIQGGTFHAFAFSILRQFPPVGFTSITVMDAQDITTALQHCREELKAGKGDRSFPRNQTILSLISKSRNKEDSLDAILHKEAHHILPHLDAIEAISASYALFKQEKGLMDYDDLLFYLEEVLRTNPDAREWCRNRFTYIMIDEYQDTNPVQARIAALLAGGATYGADGEKQAEVAGNIMVVGDDAQSIYAFRGADVANILRFPEFFPGAKVIRLEENYRSTQPILTLSNYVLENAVQGYKKTLFTQIEGGKKPNVIHTISDRSQANLVLSRISDLLRQHQPQDIAVLFRSGFHSSFIEIQLNKLGIRFRKFGGIRYAETSHVKDVMSFARLIQNPLDYTSFSRIASFCKGVGPKTTQKLYQLIVAGDSESLTKSLKKFEQLASDLAFIDGLKTAHFSPAILLKHIIDHFSTRLPMLYPDDYPYRQQGLEQLLSIAVPYTELDMLIADLSLDDPLQEEDNRNTIVLSTIHSAKGLEWSAVLLIDLVEERFPSRHSMNRVDEFEEERRLMYVACTRAKEHLDLFVPASMYDRTSGGSMPTLPSPFIRELPYDCYTEWHEGYTGQLATRERGAASSQSSQTISRSFAPAEDTFEEEEGDKNVYTPSSTPVARPEQCGFCHHRIFGRGKIIQHLPPDKYRVNFPGFGLKVIMAAYLTLEE